MARVFTRTDRRGRTVYWIDYGCEGLRRRERVGFDQGQAEDALESRLTDIRRGKFDGILPQSNVTLEQLQADYFRKTALVKTTETLTRQQDIMKRLLIPKFGKAPLHRIRPEQVEDYRADRKADKAAASTINQEVQLLKNVVKKAVEWGRIRENKIAGVKPLKTPPGRCRYLEPGQIGTLLAKCPAWLKPIVLIDLNTGMRRGEIIGLQRENLDRKNRLIILKKTKNNTERVIPMNQVVYDVFESIPPRLDTPFIFAEKDGLPFGPNKVSMAFRRARKAAGIEDFRMHDLRHHFGSYLAMKGQGFRTIQELLGHKDPRMTMRYTHLNEEVKRVAVEALNDLSEVKAEAKGKARRKAK